MGCHVACPLGLDLAEGQRGRLDPWTNAAVLVDVPAEGGGEKGSMQVPSVEF